MSSTTQAKSGFWGVPTATIDWCEDNYEMSPYFAEFWNTVSNSGMILLALYGIMASVRHGFELRFILGHISLLIVGVGSWLFHMTLKYEMQLLDELPMIVGSAAQIYIVYEIRRPKGRLNSLLFIFLLLYCFVFVGVYLVIREPIFHEVLFSLAALALAFMDFKLAVETKTLKFFFIGLGIFLFASFLWLLDNHLCPSLTFFRRHTLAPPITPLAPYIKPLTQLHSWWHLLAGYGVYMQNIYGIYNRQKILMAISDRAEHDFELGYVGVNRLPAPRQLVYPAAPHNSSCGSFGGIVTGSYRDPFSRLEDVQEEEGSDIEEDKRPLSELETELRGTSCADLEASEECDAVLNNNEQSSTRSPSSSCASSVYYSPCATHREEAIHRFGECDSSDQ